MAKNKKLRNKFSEVCSSEHERVRYECATQSYKKALAWLGFCGGPKSTSIWLTRDSILNSLKQFGFNDIHINFDTQTILMALHLPFARKSETQANLPQRAQTK